MVYAECRDNVQTYSWTAAHLSLGAGKHAERDSLDTNAIQRLADFMLVAPLPPAYSESLN
jgi:hypothetical protein